MNQNEDYIDSPRDDAQDNEFLETFYNYVRYWKWFVFSVIFALILGYVYLKLVTPKYKIETDLLIKPDKSGANSSSNDLLQDLNLFTSDKIIDNEVQILKSKDILEKVIRALN